MIREIVWIIHYKRSDMEELEEPRGKFDTMKMSTRQIEKNVLNKE